LVNLAVALLLGGMVGAATAIGRTLTDRSVRSRADALAAAGFPVLGAFPRVRPAKRTALPWIGRPVSSGGADRGRTATSIASRLVTDPAASAGYAEAFNQLFANLALGHRGRRLKTVVFTSALPGEGKTLSAVNFALLAAARGDRVLLIDADLRCGVIGEVFGLPKQPGLAELLARTASFDQVARPVPAGDHATLAVIPAGKMPAVPGRVLTIERIHDLLSRLAPKLDYVVVDTPPVNLLADAALLGSAADGVVVVVRAGHTPAEALRHAMDQLEATKSPVLGLLLNDIDLRRNETDDDSYRYLIEAERYHATVT